jgi:hypothetical protein
MPSPAQLSKIAGFSERKPRIFGDGERARARRIVLAHQKLLWILSSSQSLTWYT